MRIITNADDFGMDEDTVRATIECLDAGALTSATIMPNMPGTAAAAAYARGRPDRSFGVHLTYVTDTVEAPLVPPAQVPTLAGPHGRFRPSQEVRVAALRGRLSVADVERETAAQIQRLLDLGVRVSHVDSHGHLHKFGPFRAALANVLPRFGIRRVRAVQNVYLDRPLRSPTYWFGPWWRRRVAAAFDTTPDFFMPISGTGDTTWPDRLLARLPAGPAGGPIEVGVHPGYAEPWRDAERRAVRAFADAARARGHELVPWDRA
ncbi:MAG TPA: ChbG/HpnK family deacetylase [Humisphaera sp.]